MVITLSDFFNELGGTLDSTLRLFRQQNLSVEDIISLRNVDYGIASELLFALYRRGFIRNLDFKNYDKPADIDLNDFFRISIEGLDYLELHRNWWARFWFRSVVCPIVVSFITAINAEPLWNLIKKLARFIYASAQ